MTPHKRFPATWLSRHDIGKPQGVLFLLWILLNAFFLLHRGIYLEGESAKYIYQGQHLLDTGAPESANFWLYSVQIALVACCLKLHLSFYPIIVIQLLFNGIATAFFYKTLELLFAKKRIAVVGTLLLQERSTLGRREGADALEELSQPALVNLSQLNGLS